MTLGSWLAALCTRFRAFEALASRFFLFKPFNPRLPKTPLYAYKSSQVKFLLSTQIQNSPPLVPGAGSLRRRQNLNHPGAR